MQVRQIGGFFSENVVAKQKKRSIMALPQWVIALGIETPTSSVRIGEQEKNITSNKDGWSSVNILNNPTILDDCAQAPATLILRQVVFL